MIYALLLIFGIYALFLFGTFLISIVVGIRREQKTIRLKKIMRIVKWNQDWKN